MSTSTAVGKILEAQDQAAEAPALANDMLRGAAEIALFVYGAASNKEKKRIYHLVDCGRLPVFRLGNQLCARKSTLFAFADEQERASLRV